MNLNLKKYIKNLCIAILGLLSFCGFKNEVHAETYSAIFRSYKSNGEARWYSTSSSKDGKHTMTDTASGYFIMSDGKIAYCVEPGVAAALLESGIKYNREELTTSNLSKAGISDVETFRKLQRISFYGYGYNGDTSDATFVATQQLIWQILGKASIKSGVSSSNLVTDKMKTIENRIANATKLPSFDEESRKSPVGESITFTDTEKVLSNFKVKECKGCTASISGNNLVVSSNNIGKATVTLERVNEDTNEYANDNYLYTVGNYQNLAVLGNPVSVQSKVSVEFEGSTIVPVKRDAETGAKPQGDATLEGAIYGLYDANGKLLEELVTDNTGAMTSKIKLVYGTYTIKELKAPKGYVLNTKEYTFTVDENNIGKNIKIELFDSVIKSDVIVEKKYGADDEGFHIEKDAEFDILNSEGEIVGHLKSDGNGMALIKLPYGNYILKQTKGKDGYAFIDDVKFSVTENGKIVTIRAINLKLGRINITKTDIDGKDVIEGATIQVYRVNANGKNELIYEGTTDKDGQIHISNLTKGKYYFVETNAPKGYILNTDKHNFEITEYGTVLSESFINEKYSTFTITKFELGGKDIVEGATIEIYQVNDDGSEELIYTGKTDASGKIYLDEIEKGKYYFIEKEAPEGYILNTEKHNFEITENGKDYEESFENDVTKVTLEKRSSNDNSLLEGAEFCIYSEDGTLIACGVTDKTGTVTFDKLPYGKYYFVETKAPDGSGFRTKARFAQFFNIPELMSLFKEIADIQTSKMLNLPVPKLKGGDYKTIVAPKSDELGEYVEKLAERSEIIRNGCDPRIDNMLLVTNDGRKAALDLRMIDPNMPDLPNSKINMAVENIYRIWLENKEDKLTQLVFCDLSTPKNDGTFNVYDDIKNKLIAKGVPEEEIEFIHNAKTNPQKLKLFEDMRNGNKRILLGSTSKMGAGMNVQDKLVALHHLDCPWRPSDIEQREGRILRQGNQNQEVEIYRYVTEGSFDAYSYQLIQTKSTFINQIMANSNGGGRTAEDLDRDTLTYAEVKALASGNPLILDKFKVENELKQLYLSKTRYDKSHMELEAKYNRELPRQLKYQQQYLESLESDIPKVQDLSADNFRITIRDQHFTSRKEASTKFYQTLSLLKTGEEIKIGEISGFDIVGTREELRYTPVVWIKGAGKYKVEINNIDEIGNILKLENMLKSLQNKIDTIKEQIEYTNKQMKDAKEELDKPFTSVDRIKELQKEKARIDSELDLDKQEKGSDIIEEKEEKLER